MNRLWVKRILFAIGGAAVGYAYYTFIGCTTGTCPITSNPLTSSLYGAAIGLVLTAGNGESGRH
jgi:hypothetical protein